MPFRGVPSPFVDRFKIVGKSGEREGARGGALLETNLIWKAKNAISRHHELRNPTLGGGMMWTQLRICVHVGTCLPLDVHLSRWVAHAYVGQIF